MSNLQPAFGYALVRVVEPGQSHAGIDLSAAPTVQTEYAGVYLVRASEGHIAECVKIPCVIPAGARLYLSPVTRETINRKGEKIRQDVIRLLKVPGAPDDERMCMLCDVFAWEAPGRDSGH